MIAIFSFAIVALVLAGLASYAVYATIRSTETMTLVQRNVVQMDGISAALKSNVRRVTTTSGGVYFEGLFAPTPDVDNPMLPSASFVPGWIVANARTPWGATYGYCAYAADTLGDPLAANVAPTPVPYNSTAGVRTGGTHLLTAPDGSQQLYMASGARPANVSDDTGAPAVLGFVLSPAPQSSSVPSCDSVVWKAGIFRVMGPVPGAVVAIADDVMTRSAVPAPAVMTRYVTDGGVGDGGASTGPSSLSAALAEWKATKPAYAVFMLASGNQTLGATDFDLTSSGLAGHHLRLVGTAAPTIVNSGTSAAALKFDADLSIEGLAAGAKVAFAPQPGARMQVVSSTLRYVFSEGAFVTLGPGTSVSAAATDVPSGMPGEAAIDARGGQVLLADTLQKSISAGTGLTYGLSMRGATLVLDVPSLAVTSPSRWLQLSGGARLASQPSIPVVYLNGGGTKLTDQDAMPQPDIANGQVSSPTGSCIGDTCTGTCTSSDFLLSGSCDASLVTPPSNTVVAIVKNGALSNGSYLPNAWQCKFAAIPTVPGASTTLSGIPSSAVTALCGKLQNP